jgi:hypothetical protein
MNAQQPPQEEGNVQDQEQQDQARNPEQLLLAALNSHLRPIIQQLSGRIDELQAAVDRRPPAEQAQEAQAQLPAQSLQFDWWTEEGDISKKNLHLESTSKIIKQQLKTVAINPELKLKDVPRNSKLAESSGELKMHKDLFKVLLTMWKSRHRQWIDDDQYEHVIGTLILYGMQLINMRRTEVYIASILPGDANKHYLAYKNATLGEEDMEEIKQAIQTANLLRSSGSGGNSHPHSNNRGRGSNRGFGGRGRGRGQSQHSNFNPFNQMTGPGSNGASQNA